MSSFAAGLIIDSSKDDLSKITKLIDSNKSSDFNVEVVIADISSSCCTEIGWLNSYHLTYLHLPKMKISEVILTITQTASSEWLLFGDLINMFPEKIFENYHNYLCQNKDSSLLFLTCIKDLSGEFVGDSGFTGDRYDRPVLIHLLDVNLQRCYACLFKRNLLKRFEIDFISTKDCVSAVTVLMALYLLDYRDKKIGIVGALAADSLLNRSSFLFPVKWSNKETYELLLRRGYLHLLQESVSNRQEAPSWLQRTVLLDLLRYFEIDSSERSPTVIVNEAMSIVFHELMSKIMRLITITTLESFVVTSSISYEATHALSSYKCSDAHSPVSVVTYDHDMDLLCLRYYFHGQQPEEEIYLDNHTVESVHAKFRSCKFYRRKLLVERILWLSPCGRNKLNILLDGKSVFISSEEVPNSLFFHNSLSSVVVPFLIRNLRSVFGRGMYGQRPLSLNFKGLKVRLVRGVSRILSVFSLFKNIWIFIDRDNEADDNAEHMYRWVKFNYPERNIFFFLDRSSCHWKRLKKEGFRLVSSVFLRKLLFLNSQCVVSSQAEYINGGLEVKLYGDLMKWRFVNLRHGVSEKDQSHWLNNMQIDLLVASCPAEYNAIVGDDTPYTFTTKEVCLTGMPRYDSLLELAGEVPLMEIDTVLVMPTWRGSLTDNRSSHAGQMHERIAESDYIKTWRAFLCSKELSLLMNVHNKKLVFMPHHNMLPYLELFDLPDDVQVVTKNEISIQKLFCRTSIMVTDYSSVAFEIAYLQRAVVYFQFDRDKFYGGDHNWREGYFDYDTDGFGPVAKNSEELISFLTQILQNGSLPIDEYQQKMENTFLCRDGQCCKRVYDRIIGMFKTYE